ncbi:MAG: hypothetical protein GF353_14130 [Candidatus Lokiarchaeota archaeon]|nr:hypothetical protein [Candidatus Lokiarchaeota archaeon]
MRLNEDIGKFVAELVGTIKEESLEWQKKHQAEILHLKAERELAEKELAHKIEELETRFKEYKVRVQMEEEHQTKQFSEFLISIDDMKSKMIEQFRSMPLPIALMIHHHATELLKQAWHNPDSREKLKNQNKFTKLMMTISEELIEGADKKMLPEKTIELISE